MPALAAGATLDAMEQLPEILVAIDEYRDRMTRVLAGLDDLQVAVAAQGDVDTATFLARATDHLRAGDFRLGHLAARLGPVDSAHTPGT